MSRGRALSILLAVAVCLSCKQQPDAAKPGTRSAAPQTRATVLTVRTTIAPGEKSHTHTVVIANGRARNTGEHDTWRLFDTKAKTITYVDDIERTFRVEELDDALRQRRAALAASLPPSYPRIALRHTRERRQFLGVSAEEHLIAHSGYKRQLWLAEHPAVPAGLFAMMHASERASSPLAPVTRAADESLFVVRGYPLLDRSEIAYGNQKMVIERTVVSVEQREVAAALLDVPKSYKDVTPKPAPAKSAKKKSR